MGGKKCAPSVEIGARPVLLLLVFNGLPCCSKSKLDIDFFKAAIRLSLNFPSLPLIDEDDDDEEDEEEDDDFALCDRNCSSGSSRRLGSVVNCLKKQACRACK